jgi:hypothetical protein
VNRTGVVTNKNTNNITMFNIIIRYKHDDDDDDELFELLFCVIWFIIQNFYLILMICYFVFCLKTLFLVFCFKNKIVHQKLNWSSLSSLFVSIKMIIKYFRIIRDHSFNRCFFFF